MKSFCGSPVQGSFGWLHSSKKLLNNFGRHAPDTVQWYSVWGIYYEDVPAFNGGIIGLLEGLIIFLIIPYPGAPRYLNSRLLGCVTIGYIEPRTHYLGKWSPRVLVTITGWGFHLRYLLRGAEFVLADAPYPQILHLERGEGCSIR